jgi:hypothetical protein
VLSGAFLHVADKDAPMVLPKLSARAYPWFGNRLSGRRRRSEAAFEALVRTFNLASPLIAADPNVRIGNIGLSDYYRRHLLAALTDETYPGYIGSPDKDRPRQPTVEIGNLALWSMLQPESFWGLLTTSEKDKVAGAMRRWAEGRTCDNNWHWFNAMALSFLDLQGYEIDRRSLGRHLDRLLGMSVADGWYRDVGFDYYTAHVFHLYGAVWSNHYGRARDPVRAAKFDQNLRAYAKKGSMLFDRAGRTNMYGRSIAYRNAVTAGLVAPFLGGVSTETLPGEARRICSSSLLQFAGRDDSFQNGLPSLGFYGPFDPAVQHYSCSASPYWMFLGYTALTLPPEHPFWSDPEVSGSAWDSLNPNSIRSEFLAGPQLLLTNHGSSGVAEIRPAVDYSATHASEPSYSRHVYSTAFPWEADAALGATAGTLSLSSGALPCRTTLIRYEEGILYRRAHFQSGSYVDFASILISGGEIRVERHGPKGLRLGHFGLPHLEASANVVKKVLNHSKTIIASVPGRSLALVAVVGWTDVAVITHLGLHPEAKESTLIYLETMSSESDYLISALLHRCDDAGWSDGDLQPVTSTILTPENNGLRLELKTGQVFNINFSH